MSCASVDPAVFLPPAGTLLFRRWTSMGAPMAAIFVVVGSKWNRSESFGWVSTISAIGKNGVQSFLVFPREVEWYEMLVMGGEP